MTEHRPFPPSPRRLALAQRAGHHGASPHVTTAVAWLAFLVTSIGLGHAIAARLGEAVVAACAGDGRVTSAATLGDTVRAMVPTVVSLALPLLVAAALAAIAAHIAQTRALWLPRRRIPGAPRLPRDADHRALAYAAVLGLVTLGWLWLAAPAIAAAGPMATIASAGATLVATLAALAAVDAVLRRVRLARGLAMTHTEQRDEARLSGADPRWRTERERRAKQSRVGDDVAADVARAALILLGDDVAVAIAWDPVREPVPRRTASGERARATQLVALGRRYGLPIHRDPRLAAELAGVGPVPEAHWPRLAEIVAATRRS